MNSTKTLTSIAWRLTQSPTGGMRPELAASLTTTSPSISVAGYRSVVSQLSFGSAVRADRAIDRNPNAKHFEDPQHQGSPPRSRHRH